MDYQMETSNDSDSDKKDTSVDLEWQVDSEWVDLSSGNTNGKKGKSSETMNSAKLKSIPVSFLPTSTGARLLVIENQKLRLSRQSESGFSYWVCSIPSCSARCVLDPLNRIKRYCGEHIHDKDVSKATYKMFINSLKMAVKKNAQIKPKTLYDAQVKAAREQWNGGQEVRNESELCLPSFDMVKTAMYNTRNAVLSSLSLKPFGDISSQSPKKGGSARSQEGKGTPKRRTNSKSSPTSSSAADMEEMEEAWSNEPHRDANLSDFEEWLSEEDTVPDQGHVDDESLDYSQGSVKSEFTPDEERIIMPLVISPKKEDKKLGGQPSAKKAKIGKDLNNEVSSDTEDRDKKSGDVDGSSTERRKYRKRPASSSVFHCPHCPYKSNRHFNVQRHEKLAHSSKKPEYSCKECGTSYSLAYRLKLHIRSVHLGEGHHCHICNRSFETATGLKSHVEKKHENIEEKEPTEPPAELTCQLCGRFFSSKSHLARHMATHVMVQPYRCYMCNAAFCEESAWLTHQSTCSQPFTIMCCLCSAVLSSPQALLAHMDQVHGRAEYSCYCGKSFPWKKSLLTHQQKCTMVTAPPSLTPSLTPNLTTNMSGGRVNLSAGRMVEA